MTTNSARMTPTTVLESFEASDFVVYCLRTTGPYEIVLAATDSLIVQGAFEVPKTEAIVPKEFRYL